MYQLDTASDHLYVANRETVSLYDAAGTYLGPVENAKRLREAIIEQAPSHGEYLGQPCDWRLPAAAATVIRPGFHVLDAGSVSYVVLDADPPSTYRGVWHLFCTSLRAIGHRIVWHLPTDHTDAYASPLTDQSATLEEQPCAIQEVRSEEVVFQGVVQGLRRHYDIWTMREDRLPLGTIGVDDRGYKFQVAGQRNRNRLDELNAVECVVNP